MFNISNFLETRAGETDRDAVIWPSAGVRYTYPELFRKVQALSSALVQRGVGRGDRVCIYMDSCPAFLIAYFSIWRAGAVAVPANAALREQELAYILADSGARALICGGREGEVAERISDSPFFPDLVVCDGARGRGTLSLDSLMEGNGAEPSEAAPCGLTTRANSNTRLVRRGSQKAPFSRTGTGLQPSRWSAKSSLSSLGHVPRHLPHGAYRSVLGDRDSQSRGTWVIMERFSEPEYLRLVEEYGITVLASMPPVIHGLIHAPPGTEEALSTVRVMISGGGQLLPAVWEAFDRRYRHPHRQLVRPLRDDRGGIGHRDAAGKA